MKFGQYHVRPLQPVIKQNRPLITEIIGETGLNHLRKCKYLYLKKWLEDHGNLILMQMAHKTAITPDEENLVWCRARLHTPLHLFFPSTALLFLYSFFYLLILCPLSMKTPSQNHNQALNNCSYKHWGSLTMDQHNIIYIFAQPHSSNSWAGEDEQLAQNATLQLQMNRDSVSVFCLLMVVYGWSYLTQ